MRITLIVSLIAHLAAFVAFQISFENDLERAAGAAAAAASDGTITIPVEVVVEAMLPSAPTPVNSSAAESEKTAPQNEPTIPEIAKLMPPPPEPAPVKLPEAKIDMPPPPEPAPVVLPTQREAQELALPEEATAKPVEAKTAAIPETPAQTEEAPPLPQPRRAPPQRQEKREEAKPAERPSPRQSAPSRAASPSRAAAADSPGSSGAGGRAEAGGRAVISSYQAQVLAHLSRHRIYPPEARSQGITGVARVTFSLGRNGQVLSVALAGGSGRSILDEAALSMVRRAAPFPPFPAEIGQSRLAFGAPIRFDLR